MEDAPRKRILILAGGFAGLTVAMELEKKLAQNPSVEITLVNHENSSALCLFGIRRALTQEKQGEYWPRLIERQSFGKSCSFREF